MDRTEYVNQITTHLGVLAERVKASSNNGRTDINVDSEMTVCGLVNRIMGWNLKNLNTRKANFPGIDLADWDRRIAVQVTATATGYKVNHTLDEFLANGFSDSFDRLIVVIITNDRLPAATQREQGDFRFDPGMDIWNLSTITGFARNLPNAWKLEEIARFLDQELGAKTLCPKHLLPGAPSASPSFVAGSRDRELAQARRALGAGEPVFLWGVGGIGKTEVAIQLAKHHAPAKGAYFLRFQESLRQTILWADFSGYRFEGLDNDTRDREYSERMGILRTEYAGAMLIIDNFDRAGKTLADLTGEKAYQDLTAMGIRLVFTTRSNAGDAGIEIGKIAEEDLLALMRKSYKNAAVSDERLLKLIRAVDGHTLMVDLMAKTLQESLRAVTPEEMLDAFRKGDLKRKQLPSVHKHQPGRSAQGRIDDHLRTLFDLSAMNPAERAVLRCATLLPEDGMDALLFKECLNDRAVEKPRKWYEKLFGKKREVIPSEQDAFMGLTKTGWLAIDAQTNLLTIHPVIREVCLRELKPTDENCQAFLVRLWNRYPINTFYDTVLFQQLAKCFSMASDKLADQVGNWAYCAGRFWDKLGQAQTALRYHLRMLERREANLPPDSLDLATAYNNVGGTYGALGDHQKALGYHQKALAIRETVLPPDHPDLATSYAWMGDICGKQGDHRKALEYHQKALAIFEKALPADHPDLATSYAWMGDICGKQGDPQKALEYALKALTICEKVLPADHPDLAGSYNNVGYTYGTLGDHQKALEYHQKALAIREKVLPPDHPSLATAYNNVGLAYGNLGDHRKALEHLLKALAIFEKVLPPDHPDLATSYNNVGSTYYALGDHQKALEHLLKALALREKVLLPDHPDLALSYNNVGCTYGEMGDYPRALEYLEKALDIYERAWPEGHPDIEMAKGNIAWIREEMAE